jgi:putative membrane protein (TIGR04086 family)
MRKNDDKRNISHGFAISAAIGTAVGFFVILILFAIFAAVIASGKLSENLMVYITAFAAFLGSMFGAITAARRLKSKIMTVSLSVGTLMFLITLFGSMFSDAGNLIGKLTPALLISLIAGGLINVRKKKYKHA